jgi:hypothetical protein
MIVPAQTNRDRRLSFDLLQTFPRTLGSHELKTREVPFTSGLREQHYVRLRILKENNEEIAAVKIGKLG